MKTIFLRQPVILRTRVDDPEGMPPTDLIGQPAKNRDGTPAKPFKIVEVFLKKGVNTVEDDVAAHPYLKHHIVDAPRSTADDFSIEQLQAMIDEKRAKILAKKPPPGKTGAADDKEPLPWPNDDQLQAMKPAELSALIVARGGKIDGVKAGDLLSVAIDLRAAQAKK